MNKQAQDLMESIKEKYGEWLEMEGSRSPEFLNEILVCLLLKEKEMVRHYRKLITHYEKKKERFQ